MIPNMELVNEVTGILADEDPIGLIASGAPETEYYIEAFDIVKKQMDERVSSHKDLQKLIFEVFVDSFTPDLAGPLSKYEDIAKQVSDATYRFFDVTY